MITEEVVHIDRENKIVALAVFTNGSFEYYQCLSFKEIIQEKGSNPFSWKVGDIVFHGYWWERA